MYKNIGDSVCVGSWAGRIKSTGSEGFFRGISVTVQ